VAFAFHHNPLGLRLELADAGNREVFEAWTAGSGLNL
jgi:hypothetical protein